MNDQDPDDIREELVEAVDQARNALFDAIGTRREADAQGELARAENALAAHDSEFPAATPLPAHPQQDPQ